jgi:hypothetical protein
VISPALATPIIRKHRDGFAAQYALTAASIPRPHNQPRQKEEEHVSFPFLKHTNSFFRNFLEEVFLVFKKK